MIGIQIEQKELGYIYIVPTPIGNLGDFTKRGIEVLNSVDYILAENIKRTNFFLKKIGISGNFISMNRQNEKIQTKKIIFLIKKKKNIAIVSDGGTPLISDPGLYLIKQCYEKKIRVIPLPGPCAAITALSASGLSSLKFCYEGFLPSKTTKRLKRLKELKEEKRTIIFYESTHRIEESLENMVIVFGKDRKMSIAKELTKMWETIYSASAKNVLIWLKKEPLRCKGEWVVIIEGYKDIANERISIKIKNAYSIINKELSSKKSVEIISKLYKISKNKLYKFILKKKMTKKKINV